jgi:recombinational DNA repair ATPase RecF
LDDTRQALLLGYLAGRQVFVTCCDRAHAEKMKGERLFFVQNGGVVESKG